MPRDVSIDPALPGWAALAATPVSGDFAGATVEAWRTRTRVELGLPASGPIIATGHQPLVFHPGILAKYLATDAAARAAGGTSLQVIVDQDTVEFEVIDIPVHRADEALAIREVRIAPTRPGVPVGRRPAITPDPLPTAWSPALPSVSAGLTAIHEAFAAHVDAPDAARQVWAATSDLLRPWIDPMPAIAASDLMRTDFVRALATRMVEDPWACAGAYNRAITAAPDAGLAPLVVRDDMVELPFWRLDVDGTRRRADDAGVAAWLERPNDVDLLPRALMMTAILRVAVADLFVHGTGGATYDIAMAQWIRDWLAIDPAPMTRVTATMRLPFDADGDFDDGPTWAALRQAVRHGRHDPMLLDAVSGPSADKRTWLDRIEALPRRSAARREAYGAMHRWLRSMRETHASTLGSLEDQATQARRRRDARPIVQRRTWAFPLYPPDAIGRLAAEITSALSRTPA